MQIKPKANSHRQLLQKANRGNIFGCTYSVSPYPESSYGCVHCVDKTWETREDHTVEGRDEGRGALPAKLDAAEGLKREIRNRRREVICVRGYQPAERKQRIVREILEVLGSRNFPIHIVTWSDIVLDDLELISRISTNGWCTVTFIMNTLDGQIAGIFEPDRAQPGQRLEALARLSKEDISTGLALAPILPHITDSNEQLEELIGEVKRRGAKYVLFEPLSLKNDLRSQVVELLKRHYPELLLKYRRLYEFGSAPDIRYAKKLGLRIESLIDKHGLSSEPPLFMTGRKMKQLKLESY